MPASPAASPAMMRACVVGSLLVSGAALDQGWDVDVDFSTVVKVSKTVTTLQVVSNPILDRELVAPNGTRFPNPIHDAAWESLAALGADLVRYVPWYPYPKKSVAELDAPSAATSWDFTYITPMLDDFMAATYGRNHSTVLNFATQPCWLFGDAHGQKQNCSYPANPDESFFGYVRGSRANLLDPTAKDLAGYYARLLSYLVNGEFVDELGKKHTGGPKYSNYNRAHGHVWELFNEAEHGYSVEQYIHDYAAVVPAMIEAVGGPDKAPMFMGIGGATWAWVDPFLNRSSWPAAVPPIDYISLHFYAGCSNRTDPSTYSAGFFGGAAGMLENLKQTLAKRDASSMPAVKIDLDELGVIMPDDNNPSYGIDGNLPDIYWNAAGAMYAFIFAKGAAMGVEVLGHSQLAGSPKIPEWGIPLPQYPSVSLLDWRTGYGNARYWVLKLLIEEFAPGDELVHTKVTIGDIDTCEGSPQFCGKVEGPGYGAVTLKCCDRDALITAVDFADWGTPGGSCGGFAPGNCSHGAAATRDWVAKQCVGKRSCALSPFPALGDPCVNVVKSLVVQAHCSSAHGGVAISSAAVDGVVALAARTASGGRKVLLINTVNAEQQVTLKGFQGAAVQRLVDPKSVQAASKQGIRTEPLPTGPLTLLPFAVAVVKEAADGIEVIV